MSKDRDSVRGRRAECEDRSSISNAEGRASICEIYPGQDFCSEDLVDLPGIVVAMQRAIGAPHPRRKRHCRELNVPLALDE